MDRVALDGALLDAHRHQDGAALVRLYAMAGDQAEHRGDVDAACFYLTHALVFALQLGDPAAQRLNQRLAARGRATIPEV